jgi:hypothetical protein
MLVWDNSYLWTDYNSGRKSRFAIDYKSLPFEPKISDSMKKRYGFINNTKLRRMSILTDPSKTKKSQYSRELKTDDPIAEIFYNEFLTANKSPFYTSEMLKPFIRYYIFDEDGTDLPIIPPLESNTANDKIKSTFNGTLILVLAGVGLYLFFNKDQEK